MDFYYIWGIMVESPLKCTWPTLHPRDTGPQTDSGFEIEQEAMTFPLGRFQSGLHSWKLEFVFVDVGGFYISVRAPVALETPWSTSHCHGSLQMIFQLHCCLWTPCPFLFSLAIYLGSLQNHTFSTETRKSTYPATSPNSFLRQQGTTITALFWDSCVPFAHVFLGLLLGM